MAAAAPEQRRANNLLFVDNDPSDDNSVIKLHENTMTALGIFPGDGVLVKGKKNKETLLICTSDPTCDEGKARFNGGTRKNLAVELGDVVGIHILDNIPYGAKVSVLPFADSIEGITGDLFEVWLKPYFSQAYRPVKVDDTFIVRGNMRAIEFKVTAIEVAARNEGAEITAPYCIVGPNTQIFCEGALLERPDYEEMVCDDIEVDDYLSIDDDELFHPAAGSDLPNSDGCRAHFTSITSSDRSAELVALQSMGQPHSSITIVFASIYPFSRNMQAFLKLLAPARSQRQAVMSVALSIGFLLIPCILLQPTSLPALRFTPWASTTHW
jgi:hypothetical protein